jgi:hypothetical protein
MAIGGIDNQIMITRTTDYTRDVSAALRRGELQQDLLTVRQRALDSQDPKKIESSQKADEAQLRFESDGDAASYWDGATQGEDKDSENPDQEDEAPVVTGAGRIDIRI